jgi:hypothetical protein
VEGAPTGYLDYTNIADSSLGDERDMMLRGRWISRKYRLVRIEAEDPCRKGYSLTKGTIPGTIRGKWPVPQVAMIFRLVFTSISTADTVFEDLETSRSIWGETDPVCISTFEDMHLRSTWCVLDLFDKKFRLDRAPHVDIDNSVTSIEPLVWLASSPAMWMPL